MSNEQIIKLLKREVHRIAPEARCILYGSRARTDYRADSDVDLLILLPNNLTGKDFVERQSKVSEDLYGISLKYGIDISANITVDKIFSQRKTPFTLNVLNEGIVL